MFMRITWGRLKPGSFDEYARAYAAAVTSNAYPGLRHRFLIQDIAQPDTGFSITVWATREAMEAYEADPARQSEVERSMRHLFSGQFNTQRCRVVHAESFGEPS
jgi:heme-degrading monooxygenase HmoA